MRKFLALALAALMCVGCMAVFASCDKEKTSENIITIGVFEPTTGQNAAGGKKEILGIQYANSLYPTVDIDGKTYTIKLAYADNGSDSAKAPSAAQTLISQGVSVVVGTYGSGCAIAAGDLFADAKIAAIGTSCTNPNVTLDNDYYFRVCYIDPFQGQVMASFAAEQGSKNAAVIIEAGDDYSAGFGTYFKKAFEAAGGTCQTIEFQTGETDFSATMAKLATEGIDAIFSPVSIETAPYIITAARDAKLTCPVLAGDTWDDISIAQRAGDKATDVYFSCFFDSTDTSNPTRANFVKGFTEWVKADATRLADNGDTEEISSVTPCGYDAYMAAYNAIKSAGSTDGQAIRDAIANSDIKNLITGDLKFDENGDAIKNYVAIKTIKDGGIVFYSAYNGQ